MSTAIAGAGSSAAIEARGLVRRFGDVEAVSGVDLRVEAGEIYGFLGPNGAGKSTTVRMLCTLLKPSAGTAIVAGYNVADQAGEVRLRIGVALQEAALDPKQTGRELLDLSCRLFGLDRATRLRRVNDLIGLVDIGDAIDRRVLVVPHGRIECHVTQPNPPHPTPFPIRRRPIHHLWRVARDCGVLPPITRHSCAQSATPDCEFVT